MESGHAHPGTELPITHYPFSGFAPVPCGSRIALPTFVLLSMLPVGLMHAAPVEFGTWYARSAEFQQCRSYPLGMDENVRVFVVYIRCYWRKAGKQPIELPAVWMVNSRSRDWHSFDKQELRKKQYALRPRLYASHSPGTRCGNCCAAATREVVIHIASGDLGLLVRRKFCSVFQS